MIYLSGPIQSPIEGVTPERLKQNFYEVELFLRERDHAVDVVNPLNVRPECDGNEDGTHTWACWMRWDLKAMMDCEAICLLPGWNKSKGALVEHRLAVELGFTVLLAAYDSNDGWRVSRVK